jgi:hypothetical protein
MRFLALRQQTQSSGGAFLAAVTFPNRGWRRCSGGGESSLELSLLAYDPQGGSIYFYCGKAKT